VTWCALVALGSTASRTVVRSFLVNHALIRGGFALGLVFAIASVALGAVTVLGNLFNEKSLWIAAWVLAFFVFQLVPPLLRWQWRSGFSIFGAAVCATTIALVLFSEWLWPSSPMLIAVWVVICTAFTLLNVKTADIFSHQAEVWKRLRARLRMRRLPVRINISRA
jgi:hypothetical protein